MVNSGGRDREAAGSEGTDEALEGSGYFLCLELGDGYMDVHCNILCAFLYFTYFIINISENDI